MFLIFGLILGIIITYCCLQPRLKSVKKLDEEIEQRNKIAQDTFQKISGDIINSKTELSSLNAEKSALTSNIETLKSSIELINTQADEAADVMYKKALSTMQEQLSQSAQIASEKYQQLIAEYEKDYLQALKDCGEEFQRKMDYQPSHHL